MAGARLVSIFRNPGFIELLPDLMSTRDEFAGRIKNNDQSFPLFLALTKAFMMILGAPFALIVLYKMIKEMFRQVYLHSNGVEGSIADLGAQITDRKKSEYQKESGDQAMFTIAKKDVYVPVFEPLRAWRKILIGWKLKDQIKPETLISDFNTVLNLSAEALRLMVYSPNLMWDDKNAPLNEDYQKSYSDFIMLSLNTLNILSKRLKTMDLSENQRAEAHTG